MPESPGSTSQDPRGHKEAAGAASLMAKAGVSAGPGGRPALGGVCSLLRGKSCPSTGPASRQVQGEGRAGPAGDAGGEAGAGTWLHQPVISRRKTEALAADAAHRQHRVRTQAGLCPWRPRQRVEAEEPGVAPGRGAGGGRDFSCFPAGLPPAVETQARAARFQNPGDAQSPR